jgi:hypothetical protein
MIIMWVQTGIWIVVFLIFKKTKQGWKLFIIITKDLKEEKNKMCIDYYQSGVQFTSLNHYGTLKVK